jgi:superfamily II DNA or RNA helicase
LGRKNGVAEVFTGAGKTILAMACMADALAEDPELRFAIVVPTRAMARQWQRSVAKGFGLPEAAIGLRMAGKRGSLAAQRVVIYVINSARKALAQDARDHKLMLVVDECHRAGSRENLSIFDAKTVHRLGLSATASRDDMVDEVGNPIPADEQPHIRAIGPIFYRLDLKRARMLGLLPRYVIHHHRLPMTEPEQEKYEELCREVQESKDELRRLGVSPEACSRFCNRPPPHATKAQIAAAQALQAALFRRKQWLYGVTSRNEVARLILVEAASRFAAHGHKLRGLAFNERIDPWEDPDVKAQGAQGAQEDDEDPDDKDDTDEAGAGAADEAGAGGAAALHERLRAEAREGKLAVPGGDAAIAIYHSRLGVREREAALHDFGGGKTSILVSVKALIEGIDVPDANIGLSVASTSSGRQRIQTMGRILRAPRDASGNPLPPHEQEKLPAKEIHLLYVGKTVDEEIYIRSNWSDLTGESENKWWNWDLKGTAPSKTPDENPPKPPPTEEEAWQSVSAIALPAPWPGSPGGSLWSFRQNSIFSQVDTEVIEPAEAVAMLEAASLKIGDCRGKFVVTPRLHVVLKKRNDPNSWLALGRLSGPLKAKPRVAAAAASMASLRAETTPSRDDARDLSAAVSVAAPAPTRSWIDLFRSACEEIRRDGEASSTTLAGIGGDPAFPAAVRDALHAARRAPPAVRLPQALLTKALLVDALVALRMGASDKAAACAGVLRSRSDSWKDEAAAAIERASQMPTVERSPDCL